MAYRHIEPGFGVCPVCDEAHPLTNRHTKPPVYRHGKLRKQMLLYVHGSRGARCPGSHREPKPWVEAAGLPTWEQMPDLDRGAALMFVWKVRAERSYAYAFDHYPARYIVHPLLTALDREEACRHAWEVAGPWDDACDRLGSDEIMRLYNLALNRYSPRPGTPKTVMVDVDGTVALIGDRSPYDESLVHLDKPNTPVITAVRAMHAAGHTIVFCSGRTEGCRAATEKWLAEHVGVPYAALHMRAVGDTRKDAIVKQEIFFQHIRDHYDVVCVFDDRMQVVRMWRELGLTVFQVAEGNF